MAVCYTIQHGGRRELTYQQFPDACFDFIRRFAEVICCTYKKDIELGQRCLKHTRLGAHLGPNDHPDLFRQSYFSVLHFSFDLPQVCLVLVVNLASASGKETRGGILRGGWVD